MFGAILVAHVSFRNELPRFRQPNEWSRLYLTLAIAEEGRFAVDTQVERYGPLEDLARHDGRFYSDKPPGSALLMAPVAWLLRRTVLPEASGGAPMLVALRMLCVTLPALAFWFATRRTFAELAGSADRGLAVTVAGALGTSFFVYATNLFGHVQAAILAFAGFLAIRSAARASGAAEGRLALAGLCLGVALATDAILLLAVPLLALYAILCRPTGRLRSATALLAGALPPAAFLAAYNHACFGSPWSAGALHLVDPGYREAYARGILGVQAPDLRGLLELTLLPRRGLLWLSPVMLLAPLGLLRLAARPGRRAEALAAAGAALAVLLFATTTVDWTAGWSFGSRYLVPAIPFLLVGVAASLRAVRASSALSVAFRALACVGLATTGLAAATFPHFPPELESPVFQLALPFVWHGVTMPGLLLPQGAGLAFTAALVASGAYVLLLSWPREEARSGRAAGAAAALAAALFLAMAILSPRASSELHHRALGLVAHLLGR